VEQKLVVETDHNSGLSRGLGAPPRDFQLDELRNALPPGLDIGIPPKSSQLTSEFSNTPKSVESQSPRLDEPLVHSSSFSSASSPLGIVEGAHILRVRSIATSQQSIVSEHSTPDGSKSLGSSSDHAAVVSDRMLLSVWLPQLFEGFPKEQIDAFVEKLRDNGGFVTVKDLRDAQSNSQLTLELLQDVAGLKLGHFNRLINGLGALN
jgi:hypothetical protein